jgi:hypothetical protein
MPTSMKMTIFAQDPAVPGPDGRVLRVSAKMGKHEGVMVAFLRRAGRVSLVRVAGLLRNQRPGWTGIRTVRVIRTTRRQANGAQMNMRIVREGAA